MQSSDDTAGKNERAWTGERAEAWLARPAERLVVEGSRLLALDPSPLERAHVLFAGLIGDRACGAVFAAFRRFLEVLGPCAACPLRGMPAGEPRVSRDEALLLCLVSGIQHGDEAVVETCLDRLSCRSRCHEVEAAASSFAILLRCFGHSLLPVPLQSIERLLARSHAVTIH